MNWLLLKNSLLVSLLTAAFSVGAGLLAALLASGLGPRWRHWFFLLAGVALALPPFLVVNCWLHYLGHTGVWRSWLPLNLFSLGGTVTLMVLLFWPITLFLVSAAWRRLEPHQLETDSHLRGLPLLRWLLWPMARGAIGQSFLITFVIAMNHFAVPAILQVKVFPAELWVSFNTTFDYSAAWRHAWPLLVGPLLLLAFFRKRPVSWPARTGAVPAPLMRQRLGRATLIVSALGSLLLLGLAVGLPVWQLMATPQTWRELTPALAAGQSALHWSLLFSCLASTAVILLGLLTWRHRLDTLVWFPFLVPGVLLGVGLIRCFNRPALAFFYQGMGIVLLAYTLRYLALGWSGVAHALRGVDRDLVEAARLAGARGWSLFRLAYWPQAAPQLLATWYVTYLLCLWDVETLVLIVPPGQETLSLRVFNLLHYGHNTQVNALCLLLLVLAAAPPLLWAAARAWRSLRLAPSPVALLGGSAALMVSGCNPSPGSRLDSTLFSRVEVIGIRGTGPGQFNKPRALALDQNDNLFVVDMSGRVQKFSSNGLFLATWQMPQTDLGKPKGMCRDEQGNVVLLEPHYSRVNHFTPDWAMVAQWGDHGTNAGQLSFPRGIAINARGEVYVSEYGQTERVQRFSSQGKRFLNSFGAPGGGDGEFSRAEGLGLDSQSRVYVADSCNHRIQVFSPEGKFLRTYGRAGSGVGEFSYPYDVRVDETGRQYVCEFGNSRVQIFDANDRPLETLGGSGAAPGQFSNPWSIAIDSKGNLYVADSANHRVQKFLRRDPIPAAPAPASASASTHSLARARQDRPADPGAYPSPRP